MNKGDPTADSRYRWYSLGLLTLVYTCSYIDRTVAAIVIEPIKREFALSDAQAGFVTGLAYAMAFAVVGLPMGWLIDRVNRKKLIVCVVSIWSLCTLASGFARNYWMLAVARMSVGAAEAGGPPAALSMIGDYFSSAERSTAISIYYLSITLGMGASFALGGFVAQEYGWRAAFFVASASGFLLLPFLVFSLREPSRGAMEKDAAIQDTTPPSLRETWDFAWSQRSLRHVFAAMVFNAIVTGTLLGWISSFFIRVHHLSVAQAGLVVGAGAGLGGGIGSTLFGFVADLLARRNRDWIVFLPAVTSVLAFPLCVVMLLTSNAILAMATAVLFAVLAFAYVGPTYGLGLSLVRSRMRGLSSSALQVLASLIGFGGGPFITGKLSDLLGAGPRLRYAMLVVLSASLLAAIHYLLAARTLGEDLARVENSAADRPRKENSKTPIKEMPNAFEAVL